MTPFPSEKKALRRKLSQLGQEQLCAVILLQEADTRSKGVENPEELENFQEVIRTLQVLIHDDICLKVTDLAIDGYDLMAFGITGPKIGTVLNALLEKVMDEELPNEAMALLKAAVQM